MPDRYLAIVVGNACEPDGRIEGEIWQEAQGGGVADHPRNRKGLISDRRIKKQAFFVLQRYYREIGRPPSHGSNPDPG